MAAPPAERALAADSAARTIQSMEGASRLLRVGYALSPGSIQKRLQPSVGPTTLYRRALRPEATSALVTCLQTLPCSLRPFLATVATHFTPTRPEATCCNALVLITWLLSFVCTSSHSQAAIGHSGRLRGAPPGCKRNALGLRTHDYSL
jgi:hypothetical protein